MALSLLLCFLSAVLSNQPYSLVYCVYCVPDCSLQLVQPAGCQPVCLWMRMCSGCVAATGAVLLPVLLVDCACRITVLVDPHVFWLRGGGLVLCFCQRCLLAVHAAFLYLCAGLN